MNGPLKSRDRASDICVLRTAAPATTDEHIPARLFFDRPMPDNLITVRACAACNNGSQLEDEYVRAFLMSLRDSTPSDAIENVRASTMRQLERKDRLRHVLQQASEFRPVRATPDGQPVLGLFTRPDSARCQYARGLHFWSTGSILPADALPSIECIFNMETRPADYWEPMLAAAEYARAGTVVTVGAEAEFKYAFRAPAKGDALSVMVLDFYGSFPSGASLVGLVKSIWTGDDFQRRDDGRSGPLYGQSRCGCHPATNGAGFIYRGMHFRFV
jgi:hypothetical protein